MAKVKKETNSLENELNNINRNLQGFSNEIKGNTNEIKKLINKYNALNKHLDDFSTNISNFKEKKNENKSENSNNDITNRFTIIDNGFNNINRLLENIYDAIRNISDNSAFQIDENGQKKIISKEDAEVIGERLATMNGKSYNRLKMENEKKENEMFEILYNKSKNSGNFKEGDEKKFNNLKKDLEEYKKTKEEQDKILNKEEISRKKLIDIGKELVGVGSKLTTGNFKGEDAFNTVNGMLKNFGGAWGKGIGTALDILKVLYDNAMMQQNNGRDYARKVGGGLQGMNYFLQNQSNFFDTQDSTFSWNKSKGIKFKEFGEAMVEYSETLGRSIINFTNEMQEGAIMLKRFGFTGKSIEDFATLGKDLEDTSKYLTNVYAAASRHGLSASKVMNSVASNLKLVQQYNFQNGVNGLVKMVEKSQELRFNISEAAKFAEKVSSLEGAIDASARLSVLGGPFSMGSNPMQMLYQSLNDMEGLQDRMIKMFGNMAKYDKETGEMKIDTYNKLRMREASKAMGVSYDEMLNLSYNKGIQREVERDLGRNNNYLDEDTKKFIKNIANIDKEGTFVRLNGEKKYVRNLNEGDKYQLQKQSERLGESSGKTLSDIWVETRTFSDKLDDILNVLTNKISYFVGKIAGFYSEDEMKANLAISNAKLEQNKEEFRPFMSDYANEYLKKHPFANGDKIANSIISDVNKGSGDFYNAVKRLKLEAEEKFAEGYVPSLSEIYARKGGVLSNDLPSHVKGGINANIEGGEAIIKRASVQQYGPSFIDSINEGTYNPYDVYTRTTDMLESILTKFVNTIQLNNNPTPQTLPSIEPININLNFNGEISVGNGKIDFNNIPQYEKEKLAKLIYDQVYLNIREKLNVGYNKNDMPQAFSFGR